MLPCTSCLERCGGPDGLALPRSQKRLVHRAASEAASTVRLGPSSQSFVSLSLCARVILPQQSRRLAETVLRCAAKCAWAKLAVIRAQTTPSCVASATVLLLRNPAARVRHQLRNGDQATKRRSSQYSQHLSQLNVNSVHDQGWLQVAHPVQLVHSPDVMC
jgi:hypothetical protein